MIEKINLKVWLLMWFFTFLALTTKQAWGNYGGGSGTSEDPYLIYTAEQMNEIGVHEEDWDKHFKLMADIDLSGYDGQEGKPPFNKIGYFKQIGEGSWTSKRFRGTFDGDGHTISNFTCIDRGAMGLGVFGACNATIKNLGLVNPYVDGSTDTYDDWISGNNIGALIGEGSGYIYNCYVEGGSVAGNDAVGAIAGMLDFGTISDCHSTCNVSSFYNVGGLVGVSFDQIINCSFDGKVSGKRNYIGGLVGQSLGTISMCHTAGSVTGGTGGYEGTGGLAGDNSGVIQNCYSSAKVSKDRFVGGLVGINWSQIINCYSTGRVSGTYSVGGLSGWNDYLISGSFWDIQTSGRTWSAGGTGKTTAQMQTKSTFASAGWDFDTPIWTIDEGIYYPRLWWEKTILHVPAEYPTIQDAIDAAVNGDTVLVSPGVYTGVGNKNISFRGKTIAVRSVSGPNSCTIDCEGSGRGFSFSEREPPSSTLEGFTIRNGGQVWAGGGIEFCGGRPTIRNCVIANNSADWAGGISCWGSNPTISNCTIIGNHAYCGGGIEIDCGDGYNVTLSNCIIWGNQANNGTQIACGIECDWECGLTVSYCDIEGGLEDIYVPWSPTKDLINWGEGNIDVDPCFVNPNSSDFHLLPDSPCINAGDPNYVTESNETDIDGELRVMLGRVDMGADEFNPFEIEFIVVNKRRIGRTMFEYDCNAYLHNISLLDLENIQLEIAKIPENVKIIDPNITFGDVVVLAGQSATSIDTCTFEVNRAQAIEPAAIIWWSSCDLVAAGQTMQHSGSSIILLEEDISGELTGEGDVNYNDLLRLAEQWLWVGSPGGIEEDISEDGIVNFVDFALLVDNWGW